MRSILILMDSINRRFLKSYDPFAEAVTPYMDEFARDAVRFDNHFIASAPCMPARRDILTGRMNFLERGWGGLEPFDITMPDVLKEQGIFTHIVTDHAHYFETGGENYCTRFDTWDYLRGQEVDAWVSRVKPAVKLPEAYGRRSIQHVLNHSVYAQKEDTYPTPMTFQAACRWAEENKNCDDFFLMVEAFDPHEPFDAPLKYHAFYQDHYAGKDFTWSSYAPVTEPLEAVEHLKKSYLATLTMADRWLGKFLASLKKNGLYEDTLILLTTDHGHMLGEHGFTGKNYMHAYNELSHIPLFIKMPDRKHAGETCVQLTQNIDLMPTILEHHGITTPKRVKGRSMLPLICQKAQGRQQVIYGWFGRAVNVYDGRYTYFRAPAQPDNVPCYQYCAIPTTLGRFFGEDYAEEMEMGRYLPYTNYPVYRIPLHMPEDCMGEISFVRDSLLFDLQNDYAQNFPVKDRETEEKMIQKLLAGMQEAQAPEEQYERLGLAERRKMNAV